jgi:hypothetical protein
VNGTKYPGRAGAGALPGKPSVGRRCGNANRAWEKGMNGSMESQACSPSLPSDDSGMGVELFWRGRWRACWKAILFNISLI